MYVFYSIIIFLLICALVDFVYILYKKYKQKREESYNVSLFIILAMPIGALFRIIFMSYDVTFLILLKETLLCSILVLFMYLNVVVIKKRFLRQKNNLSEIKKLQIDNELNIFKKRGD